jgi:hypothetical protein
MVDRTHMLMWPRRALDLSGQDFVERYLGKANLTVGSPGNGDFRPPSLGEYGTLLSGSSPNRLDWLRREARIDTGARNWASDSIRKQNFGILDYYMQVAFYNAFDAAPFEFCRFGSLGACIKWYSSSPRSARDLRWLAGKRAYLLLVRAVKAGEYWYD